MYMSETQSTKISTSRKRSHSSMLDSKPSFSSIKSSTSSTSRRSKSSSTRAKSSSTRGTRAKSSSTRSSSNSRRKSSSRSGRSKITLLDRCDRIFHTNVKYKALFSNKITLGRGSFGEVRLAEIMDNGVRELFDIPSKVTQVVIKEIKTKGITGMPRESIEAEMQFLCRLQGKYLARYYGTFVWTPVVDGKPKGEIFYLLVEYIPDSVNLATRMYSYRPSFGESIMPPSDTNIGLIKNILYQLGDAISGLHQVGVVHRDLKPENILVINSDKGVEIKLIDFGLSCLHSEKIGTCNEKFVGTRIFSDMSLARVRAEELNFEILKASDWYSYFVISYLLLTGRRNLYGYTPHETKYPKIRYFCEIMNAFLDPSITIMDRTADKIEFDIKKLLAGLS